MKILRITLRNLASLAGTHTVDFTREPLRSAGLFSISGPTGSGKSTLLDALCLALYEKTPRLASASGEQIPDGSTANTLTPRDPGNLLRRGAAEGFAEVAFVGVDGNVYTARWSIRRARNRPEGNLQSSEMVLLGGNIAHPVAAPVVVGGKKSEVLPAIAAKVGLTFPQFTRAVLLAQNDFAVFLKSNDQERASILEALTGTERFAHISRLVFERHKKEREAVAELESRLSGASPLTPEARAVAETEHQAANTAVVQAEAAVAAVAQQLLWFEKERELAAAVARADAALAAARTAVEAAAPRQADLELTERLLHFIRPLRDAEQNALAELGRVRAQAEDAARRNSAASADLATRREAHGAAHAAAERAARALAEAQPALHNARLLDSQLEALAPRVQQAGVVRAEAEAGRQREEQALNALRERIVRHDNTLNTLSARRNALAAYADFADDLAAWRDRLAATGAARDTLARRTREADEITERVARLRAEQDKTQAAVSELQKALDLAIAAHAEAERRSLAFDPEALAARRAALDKENAALLALQAFLSRIGDLDTKIRDESVVLGRLVADIDARRRALDELIRTKLPAAQSALAASQSALKLLEAADDNSVPRLRAALLPDQPCPVCGSLHHPAAAETAHGAEPGALRALREQVAAYQKQHDELRTEQTRVATALELAEKDRAARQAALGRLTAELADARKQPPAAEAVREILALPESEQLAAVTAALSASAQARASHEKLETEQRASAAALTAALTRRDKARAVHAQMVEKLNAQKTELAAAEAASVAAVGQRAAAERDHAAHFAALAPLWERLPDARAAFERDTKAFADGFVAQVDTLRRLRQQIEEVTVLRDQERARLPGREEALAAATAKRDEALKEETRLGEELARLQKERQALFAGRPVATVQGELEAAATAAKSGLDARAGELAEAEKTAAAAAAAVRERQTAMETATATLATARAAFDRELAAYSTPEGRPFDRETVAVYLARDAAWLDAERKALALLRDELKTATGQHEVHAAALAAHRAQAPTSGAEDTVRALHGARVAELNMAKGKLVAAAAALTADDQRRRDAAALLEQIGARRRAAAPWGKLDELIGSADGAKFRAIVQRHALDILLGHANAQLDLISARYRLERLPESLNLIVCDREMADERRSVHSLSGGESFLVSLALALGLASLTSNRLRVESLFIDEGFGSLDPATLETAMSALMRLESQGRKVGVISHVTEMADAIPVQIRVVKGRGGASRLEVPGAPVEADAVAAGDVANGKTSSAGTAGLASMDVDALATKLLALLDAAEAAGKSAVSTRSLREQLGCDLRSFDAARSRLGSRVVVTGRSLALARLPMEEPAG